MLDARSGSRTAASKPDNDKRRPLHCVAATRAKRLVAELHVLIEGLGPLPPGATGAYVLLELGDHVARSTFVQAPESWYYEDGRHAFHAWGPPQTAGSAGFVHQPTDTYSMWPVKDQASAGWPQTYATFQGLHAARSIPVPSAR